METEFITYKQALALKELGFDEPCFGYYLCKNSAFGIYLEITLNWFDLLPYDSSSCKAPLKQQAFRWFRDKYQLFYTIETNCSQLSFEWGFDYTIFDKENDKWLSTEPQNCPPGETTYVTYEEAESACIDKLIEIVKNNLDK